MSELTFVWLVTSGGMIEGTFTVEGIFDTEQLANRAAFAVYTAAPESVPSVEHVALNQLLVRKLCPWCGKA